MKDLLLVGLGGLVGSISRYLITLYSLKLTTSVFPFGTLTVNLAGSLLIGVLAGVMIKSTWSPYQLFLITGFCGGFTTFSTFSLEGIKLIRAQLYYHYMLYAGISLFFGLLLCFVGFWIVQKLSG